MSGPLDDQNDDLAAMTHAATSGNHSHPHAAYGHQGDDATHEHEHSHDGDSGHNHHRVIVAGGLPLGPLSFIGAAHEHPADHEHDMVAMVASSMARLGSSWGVAQTGAEEFQVLAADGSVRWSVESYAEAVGRIGEQLAARTENPPVLAQTWRADSAFEGIPTGDGRYIKPGAIEYRNTPLPLMLQTETAGGHMGAVLAGTIEKTGMLGQTAVTSGSFDDSPAGQQFVDIINARGRFGVSIDVAEAEGEMVCTEQDEMGDCLDGRVEFSLIRIMGQTGTPFPAFEDAFVELEQQAASQIAADAAPCEGCDAEAAELADLERRAAEATEGSRLRSGLVVMASGAPAAPPLEFFRDPEFRVGDPRLVRQPSGTHGCPLTVDGYRVFGHLALHKSCHTSYTARCVPPPRSKTGYAAFMLRPLMTAEGEVVHVGHLTMGAGHASDDPSTPLDEVRAHYDGAPGAIQMASVRVGEDDFGIWFAGAIRPEATEEQIARFSQLSISGDWREVWRGKGLDLVACAAGVTVPGFPISAMAADGSLASEVALGDTRIRYAEGRPVVLVAAGVVRQPQPWERMLASQQTQIDDLGARLERAERITASLRPVAAERLLEAIPSSA